MSNQLLLISLFLVGTVVRALETAQIQTPRWAALKVARPYDPIKFSIVVPGLASDITSLDVVGQTHALWKRNCRLTRANGGLFASGPTCTVVPVSGYHHLAWAHGQTILANVRFEVSCTDGNPCNGEERLVSTKVVGKPKCMSSKSLCDDRNACTIDTCIDGICNYQAKLKAKKCNNCKGGGCNPDCGTRQTQRTCGFDGCFGQCGPTCPSGEMCISGSCDKDLRPGTCINPFVLNSDARAIGFSGRIQRSVNISQGLDVLVPKCLISNEDDEYEPVTGIPKDPEMIFQLEVPQTIGFVGLEVRTRSDVFSRSTISIIEVDRNVSATEACLMSTLNPYSVWACERSYDQFDWSSSATWMMKPGRTYFVAVEKQNAFVQATNMTVQFTLSPECTTFCPKNVKCGDSGCEGISCGTCDRGTTCQNGQCTVCVPSCHNQTCGGPDGCGGECQCFESNRLAILTAPQVEAIAHAKAAACDSLAPKCTFSRKGMIIEGCNVNQYCSSECRCLPLSARLPDLGIMPFRAYVDTLEVESNDTCAYEEGCLGGLGTRVVIKFDTKVFNQGSVPFRLPHPPQSRPDLFEYAKCHGHWHTKSFLSYELLDQKGNLVTAGQKRSFCLIDMHQVQNRPDAPCGAKYDCDKQGLSVGWTDVYDDTLDCQFIDVTDVAPGTYIVRQCVNPKRKFQEASFENNCQITRITIDPTKSPTTAAPTPPTKSPGKLCSAGCPESWIGDNYCDTVCNVAACGFDGGDCQTGDCAPGCPKTWVGDMMCDAACNIADCHYDGGDCGVTVSPTKYPTERFKPKAPTAKPTKRGQQRG